MTNNQILIVLSIFVIIGCREDIKECNNYTLFEETPGLRQYYTDYYSILFLPENKVKINTYYDGYDFTREGTYEYEIDLIECFCATGKDEDGNCYTPTARYFGTGSINITTSNDSICPSDRFDLSFEITHYTSKITITDGDCFNIAYYDNN